MRRVLSSIAVGAAACTALLLTTATAAHADTYVSNVFYCPNGNTVSIASYATGTVHHIRKDYPSGNESTIQSWSNGSLYYNRVSSSTWYGSQQAKIATSGFLNAQDWACAA